MLLEVLLGWGGELDSSELEAAVLEAGDDGTDEATLCVLSAGDCFTVEEAVGGRQDCGVMDNGYAM